MSKLIDLHLHCDLSPDSKQKLSGYFEQSMADAITVTDHLEFEDKYLGYDAVVDYKRLKSQLQDCSAKYQIPSFLGVEVGYHQSVEQKIIDYFADKQFDIVILSAHHDGVNDYLGADPSYIVDSNQYLQTLICGINCIKQATILGHLDYPFRTNKLDSEFFSNPLLEKLLKSIIAKGIALEINTRSLYEYNNLDFYNVLLPIYINYGGTLVSLGSDGHSTDKYQYQFDRAVTYLDSYPQLQLINYKFSKTL